MPIKKFFLLLSSAFLAVFILCPRNAYAYLDPGSGSFIIQMILAGLLTLSLAFQSFWKKVAGFFLRLFKRNHERKDNSKK